MPILCYTLDLVLSCCCLGHTDGLKSGSGEFRDTIMGASIRSVKPSGSKEEASSFDVFLSAHQAFPKMIHLYEKREPKLSSNSALIPVKSVGGCGFFRILTK